jgi:hypothetical protein
LETALRELARRAHRAGIQVRQLMPRDLLTVELWLAKVLDLSELVTKRSSIRQRPVKARIWRSSIPHPSRIVRRNHQIGHD